MGSDQSHQPPAGAPGSEIKSQRDEDIPYTSYSISKPISGDNPKTSPMIQGNRKRAATAPVQPVSRERSSTGNTPTPSKHTIVVVADGQVDLKDPDPELTRLSTIPAFYPIMRGSLNLPTSSRDLDLLEKLDPKNLLLLCLRYQEHLKQLSESVAFDQNALCIRIKEIDCMIQKLMNTMTEKQKKYAKYAEQFQRTSETVLVLNRIQDTMNDIIPKMEALNKMLPPGEQLEPFQMKDRDRR
ncbi:BLOC-1-related complex subunit 5-like [Ruditapes philippinarum]|uniref:BLOC-1-related complex subunit 5-like n=1 Tax=Ruditapes philippinarum TaxID=129788 RepID=UPI00295C17DF|nr:BLOC-1-related complex subunit 5-like [Ruditapes philippinarum]